MHAAENGHLPMVEYLLERGADMEAKDSVSDGVNDMKPHLCHCVCPARTECIAFDFQLWFGQSGGDCCMVDEVWSRFVCCGRGVSYSSV